MNHWWVSHNQTARHEVGGGYMWSPKRSSDGKRIAFYEHMRECAPGDLVFSFVDTKISQVGVVTSFCVEAPRPDEFGAAGNQWDREGWKVGVAYQPLPSPITPSAHMGVLAPTLPEKYSPIRRDGGGNQLYLARVPDAMAKVLLSLVGVAGRVVVDQAILAATTIGESVLDGVDVERAETAIAKQIAVDPAITETDRLQLGLARRGQGVFRKNAEKIETRCRVTGVTKRAYQVASHIKPWRKSDNRERLDGNNGLLLARHIDHLFDKGFISFALDGTLLISPAADLESLRRMSVPVDHPLPTGSFSAGQLVYMDYHRSEIFKKAHRD